MPESELTKVNLFDPDINDIMLRVFDDFIERAIRQWVEQLTVQK
jgi:hypothetical protein